MLELYILVSLILFVTGAIDKMLEEISDTPFDKGIVWKFIRSLFWPLHITAFIIGAIKGENINNNYK